ncbi:MAG TPA: hypothetical protein VK988_12895 [Acidimicrobiales bacterium]|nr:hypothetical protein [Acidimicrobiales bacterium]
MSTLTVRHADEENPGGSLEMSREELLRRARPFPTHEEMIIEELTDQEAEAFWSAINEM